MSITVKFFSSLRGAAGVTEVTLQADTVREAVQTLHTRFADNPDFLRLVKISNVILNGKNVLFRRGPRTRLNAGDVLALFPPIGGG